MFKFVLSIAIILSCTGAASAMSHPWDVMAPFQGDFLAAVPSVNSKFCTTMHDDLYLNGGKNPAQNLVYGLCLDTKKSRWTHTVDDATTVFNGTTLFTVNTTSKTCRRRP